MKKSAVTQELVNVYPPESRVRTKDTSVGYQLLNTIGVALERMQKEIQRGEKNEFIVTANLDEPDLMYKVLLPVAFDFDIDNSDPLNPRFIVPTVSGMVSSVNYSVTATQSNTLEEAWFDVTPNRVSLETTISGTTDIILDATASGVLPWTGSGLHHTGGGVIFVELTSGLNYITQADNKTLMRGQVVITGRTRKGSEVVEHIFYPWDQKQPTVNEWKEINKIEGFNLEDSVHIKVTTGDFLAEDYLSRWNLRYSENRNKIDEFWGLGDTTTTLDRRGYVVDEWPQLIQGIVEKDIKQSWEMLDDNSNTISGIDIALQPFRDRAWVIDTNSKLYLYDISDSMPENIEFLRDRTAGSNVQLDADFYELILGEDIEFIPWHARPLQEIDRYRIWYIDPAGTKRGLLQGTPVSFTSDFWVVGQQLKRTIEDVVTMTTTMRGEYQFALECRFLDGTIHNERVIFRVLSKSPEQEFDLSSLVTGIPTGIDFDSDQYLWIRTTDGHFQINLHHDTMIVDYKNKVLYFRENYTEVSVINNG